MKHVRRWNMAVRVMLRWGEEHDNIRKIQESTLADYQPDENPARFQNFREKWNVFHSFIKYL